MASSSFSKLLSILGYEHSVDLNEKAQLMQCVCWLEDRKIRELEIAERESLRSPNDFDDGYASYLKRLGCPFPHNPSGSTHEAEDTLAWLVSHAISVE